LQCVAVYYGPHRCSVLQCIMDLIVAVCCSVLWTSSLQCVAVYCSVLQCVAVCCSVLQSVAVCCSELQCVAECCSVLQYIADLSVQASSPARTRDANCSNFSKVSSAVCVYSKFKRDLTFEKFYREHTVLH